MKKSKSIGKFIKAVYEKKTVYLFSDNFNYTVKYSYPYGKYWLINDDLIDNGKFLTWAELMNEFVFFQLINDKINFRIEDSKEIL